MNDEAKPITHADTAGSDRIPLALPVPPRRGNVWDNAKARASAIEKGQAVALVRGDGTRSGLCVTPEGKLRRTVPKPLGKAARKQFKRLRRQLRAVASAQGTENRGELLALKRRAAQLCGVGGGR